MTIAWTPILLALHVVSIVFWIGGVGFVTLVLLPALSFLPEETRFAFFAECERRFGAQARVLILIAGASGGALIARLHLAGALRHGHAWGIEAMIALWVVFAVLLFVLEPLVLHKAMRRLAQTDARRVQVLLTRGHRVLLTLATLTILGGVLWVNGL